MFNRGKCGSLYSPRSLVIPAKGLPIQSDIGFLKEKFKVRDSKTSFEF
jgi:hypothetical protein